MQNEDSRLAAGAPTPRVSQYAILTAIRALPDFTRPELVTHTGLPEDTVQSFFKRHGSSLFERTGGSRRVNGGRAAPVWRLKPEKSGEIEAMFKGARGGAPRPDAETALRALSDDHARWQAVVTLRQAVQARDDVARCERIAAAEDWLAHERRHQRRWGSIVQVPDEILRDTDELADRIRAVRIGIDRLSDFPAMATTVASARCWMLAELRKAGAAGAFHPLEPGPDAPVDTLVRLIAWGPVYAGLSRDRLIVAALTALADVEEQDRLVLISVCNRIGDAALAAALESQLNSLRGDTDHAGVEIALLALLAVNSYPNLSDPALFPRMRSWFDRSREQYYWRPEFAPVRYACAPRADMASAEKVLDHLRDDKDKVEAALLNDGFYASWLAGRFVALRSVTQLASAFLQHLEPPAATALNWLDSGYKHAA